MIQVIGRMYLPAINGRERIVYETTFALTVHNWENFQREVVFARTQYRDITSSIVLADNRLVDVSCATVALHNIANNREVTKKDRIEYIYRYYGLYLGICTDENDDLAIREEN